MSAFEVAPKISVLMPVYNGERFLQEAVDSILAQTFTDFEFIIVDDGSTDGSLEILTKLQDPRIRIVRNRNNQGVVRSLNDGLAAAQGEFIARMDADDISRPDRLSKQIVFLETFPEIGVLGTGIRIMDSSGVRIPAKKLFTEHEALRWGLCFSTSIMHPTVMMRRKIVEEAGGYNQEMAQAEDYDLWRRLSAVTRLANLPDELVDLRRHETNASSLHALEVRQHAMNTSRLMMSHILDEDVPLAMIQPLWERTVRTEREARPLAELVYRLYATITRNDKLSTTESQNIRRDAARRLYGLSRPWLYGVGGWVWKALVRASYLDPLFALRIVQNRSLKNPL